MSATAVGVAAAFDTDTDIVDIRNSALNSIFIPRIFTARCTLVQSAVLRSHVVCQSVCPSVCLSVTLRYCDYIGWKSAKIISWLVSLGCSLFATPTSRGYSKGNTLKFGLKVAHAPDDLSVGDNRSQYLQKYSS